MDGKDVPKKKADKPEKRMLPPCGDYRTLISYQKSEVVYQIAYRFCQKYLGRGDRTKDQMIQAALSGKQNILEGSKAARTSSETEIKLTNVARASLDELLEDYLDFFRVRDLPIWDKDSKEAKYVQKLDTVEGLNYSVFAKFIETRPPETIANIAICLIHQANYLLDQQLQSLEKAFVENGGIRERMTEARLQARKRNAKENSKKF